MASIGKVAFNTDGSTIQSTLNIQVSNNPYLVYQTYHWIQ
jgi:hypothetical protein